MQAGGQLGEAGNVFPLLSTVIGKRIHKLLRVSSIYRHHVVPISPILDVDHEILGKTKFMQSTKTEYR